MTNEHQWLTEKIEFYRGLGFFAKFAEMPTEQIVQFVVNNRKESGHRSFAEMLADSEIGQRAIKLGLPLLGAEIVLLGMDENRVWWEDGETDIWPGGKIYEKAFADWSRISRGAFIISNIEEQWEGETLISVDFDWNDERYRAYPNSEYMGWIDFEVLEQINELIQPSGLSYEFPDTGDQTTFIVVLSADEKAILKGKGWSFLDGEDE